ncbi:hypothetical protein BT69DRAFT_285160 [Atractiella rhizophila]|nr:hypothetical protein BT69DRAFT_285160 [Atractiella rhizophila]
MPITNKFLEECDLYREWIVRRQTQNRKDDQADLFASSKIELFGAVTVAYRSVCRLSTHSLSRLPSNGGAFKSYQTRVKHGISELAEICHQTLAFTDVKRLCYLVFFSVIRTVDSLPGEKFFFQSYVYESDDMSEEGVMNRLENVFILYRTLQPAAWFGLSLPEWVNSLGSIMEDLVGKFEPKSEKARRQTWQWGVELQFKGGSANLLDRAPSFVQTGSLLAELTDSAIVPVSHHVTIDSPGEIVPYDDEAENTSSSQKRRGHRASPRCRRCKRPDCLGHKDILLCPEKPKIPCKRCGGLEDCPLGADEGRGCIKNPQSLKGTKSRDNAHKRTRTCRRCRERACKGYIDIKLCKEPPKIPCTKCHHLDCELGSDGGKKCSNRK